MKLIDKDALVAEIIRRRKAIPKEEDDERLKAVYGNEAFVLTELLEYIDTLEAKEVEKNVWKDPSQLPKKGEVVVACCNTWEDVICGEFKILELNIGDDTKTYRIDYLDWEYVVKWAYPKDVFPYRDSSILNYPVQFNETRIERDRTSNRALESHKAWEESLLYADRIRGTF